MAISIVSAMKTTLLRRIETYRRSSICFLRAGLEPPHCTRVASSACRRHGPGKDLVAHRMLSLLVERDSGAQKADLEQRASPEQGRQRGVSERRGSLAVVAIHPPMRLDDPSGS